MPDVFVSYSRHDAGFVHELHAFLTGAGRDVWVDWEDIPAASKWEQDIDDSIDAAESVVFVVSPSSLASEYCGAELGRAGAGGKRVVPIAIDGADPEAAPPELRQLNWIWCRGSDDREAAFAALERALDTNLEWSRAHTRLLVRAVEWDTRSDKSLLLRGKDLEEAERQLAAHAGKDPRTTELQQRYLHESRRSASRRQRSLLGGVTAALVVSVALGVVAVLQRNTANERARVAESQALSLRSVDALVTVPQTALRHAVDAFETEPTPEARLALRRAILANPIELAIPAERRSIRNSERPELGYGSDASRLLGLTPAGVLRVWDAKGRDLVGSVAARHAALGPGGRVVSAHRRTIRLHEPGRLAGRSIPAGGPVAAVAFAGRRPLALVEARGSAFVLDVGTGRRVRLDAPRILVSEARFSGDGRRVVTLGSKVRVWDTLTGRPLATLPADEVAAVSHDGAHVATSGQRGTELWTVAGPKRRARLGYDVTDVVFSHNGDLAVAVGGIGDGRIWRTRNGRLIGALPGFGDPGPRTGFATSFRPGAAFSRDGRLLALANADGIVRVWDLQTRKQVGAIEAGWANGLAFAPRGGRLAAMSWDGDVVVARAPASLPVETGFEPVVGCAHIEPRLSPDGRLVVAPVFGGAGLWRPDGTPVRVLRTPVRARRDSTAESLAFSGDGTRIAVASMPTVCAVLAPGERFGAAVWDLDRAVPLRSVWTEGPVSLDRRGGLWAVGDSVWRTADGARVRTRGPTHALAPDGRSALVSRGRETHVVQVPSGRTVAVLAGAGRLAKSEYATAAFSPDGKRVLTERGGALRLWDARTGEAVARLDRTNEGLTGYAFGNGGRLVLVRFDERAATFDAGTGAPLSSRPGSFAAISDEGRFGVKLSDSGSLEVVELGTGMAVAVQTDTGLPLTSAAFGPTPEVLVVADDRGDVHVLRCSICAGDDELLADARATLELLTTSRPKRRPITSSVA
jgi:WD40 repeat protein